MSYSTSHTAPERRASPGKLSFPNPPISHDDALPTAALCAQRWNSGMQRETVLVNPFDDICRMAEFRRQGRAKGCLAFISFSMNCSQLYGVAQRWCDTQQV